jgi:hypothetical protein
MGNFFDDLANYFEDTPEKAKKYLDDLKEQNKFLIEPIPQLKSLAEKIPEFPWEKHVSPYTFPLTSPLDVITSPKKYFKGLAENITPLDVAIPAASKIGKIGKATVGAMKEGRALGGIPGKEDDLAKALQQSIDLAKQMKESGIKQPLKGMSDLKKMLGGMPSRAEEAAVKKAAYEKTLTPEVKAVKDLEGKGVELGPDYVKDVLSYGRKAVGKGKVNPGLNVIERPNGEVVYNYFDEGGNLVASGMTKEGKVRDVAKFSKALSKEERKGIDRSILAKEKEGVKSIYAEMQKRGNVSDIEHATPAAFKTSSAVKEGSDFRVGDLSTVKGERGAIGKSTPPPKYDIPGRFRVKDTINGRKINFATDFDKAAYQLALGKKPNDDLLLDLINATKSNKNPEGLPPNIILKHARKLRARANSLSKALPKGDIDLSMRHMGTKTKGVSKDTWFDTLIGMPSEFKFGGDLPWGRQSYRPNILHPFKTGFPALKSSLKSMTEKGYNEALGEIGETPVGTLMEALHTAGTKDLESILPNIGKMKGLAYSDIPEFFSKSTLGEKVPLLGKYYVKPSKRMYDAGQRMTRAKELERIAGGEEGLLKMLQDESKGSELESIIKRVNEESGHGKLPGAFDKALEAMSYGFTAPRNMVAKAQFYNPLSYIPKTGATPFGRFEGAAYKDFMKDQAKWLAMMGGTMYGADKMGADVEPNPLASNFGIRFGDYKPDIFGGELGIMKTIPRMFTDERISSKGKEYQGDPSNDLMRFIRGRIRPGLPAMTYDAAFGYDPMSQERVNYMGESLEKPYINDPLQIPYSRWAAQQATPSWPGDIYEAATKEPLATPAAVVLGGLGFGSSTYDPFEENPYRPAKQFYKLPVKGRPSHQRKSGKRITGNVIR